MKKMFMKYPFVIILLIVFMTNSLNSQPLLDTIMLSEMQSKNVLILSSKDSLIKFYGTPIFVSYNRRFYISKEWNTPTKEQDTVFYFYFNILSYPRMSYFEKDGRIRLSYFDLKKNKKAVIHTSKLQLSYHLSLEELMKIYNYTFKDIAGLQLGIMAPYPMRKCRCFYQVDFSTGEHESVNIELYFDCKKKLRFLNIDAYDF